MNWQRIGLLTFAVFFLGFCTGTGIKICYEATSFKPYTWDQAPQVVNCYGKDFNKYQFERAIEYWKIRGDKIAGYIPDPDPEICKKRWANNMIIIRKSRNLGQNTLASTKRMTTAGTLISAIIHYSPGAQNLHLLNEHELGHALGYGHVEKEGHIMHPLYHKMGMDFY